MKYNKVIWLFCIGMAMTFHSCVEPINKTFAKVPPGEWRGVLLLDDDIDVIDTDEEVVTRTDHDGDLPFNFSVTYVDDENFYMEFKNDTETIRVDHIDYGRDRATAKDTLIIHFDDYGTYIKAIYEESFMEGNWYVPYRSGSYSIPFKATHGQSHRFTTTKIDPTYDVSGKWSVVFGEGEDAYPAIGEFRQEGTRLFGTFMTETGDYRFLEGDIEANKLSLSTFDGTHAFLFKGKLTDENTIVGGFKSGKHFTDTWIAKRDADAKLIDPYKMSTIIDIEEPITFSFEDLQGNPVTQDDPRFQNKIKLLKLSGTWCPNCQDETKFLMEYFDEHPTDEVEVIEVNFERYKEDEKNLDILRQYAERKGDFGTILYGGKADKKLIKEKFPRLEKLLSYPTLIFLDKDNKVKHVHTGFAGPATSEYGAFKERFHNIINELINQ